MKAGKLNSAAFTLTEVMVASALGVAVAAMAMAILSANIGLWRAGMARRGISEDSRIVRERVLRGIDGQFGLRHARRSQITIASNRVGFYDAGSSNGLVLLWPSNRPPAYVYRSGTQQLTRGGAFVDSFAVAATGNILNIDLTLAVTNRAGKYAQPQRIRVYLLNE